MAPTLRITTFGWIVALVLLLAVALTAALSTVSVRNAEKVGVTWAQFEKIAAQKALLLSQVRGLLGYDGIIHHFKNFILRPDRSKIVIVHKKLLQLSIALTAYDTRGLDREEKKALSALLATVNEYKKMIARAESMAEAGRLPADIDKAVKVNDGPAVEALGVLDQHLTELHRANAEEVRESVSNITFFSKISGIGLVIALLVLTLLTIWFAYWRLIRPLSSLVDAFENINPRDPGSARLPTEQLPDKTELGMLARTGNAFLDAVHDYSVLRENAETELRDREEHLTTVVENAVDAIVTVDSHGMIKSFNTSASAIFGYGVDEVINANVSILMPEPHRSEHDHYINRYLETGHAKVIGIGRELEGRRKNGSIFPLWLGLSETRTSDGIGFTGIIRDLSAEKESELRLRLAKEAAEKANQAKSEFLASMSHELRTPMNAILGFTQLMQNNPAEPPSKNQSEYLGLVVKSGNHLLSLMNQVLELSKIEVGHLEVSLEDTNVGPIIEECLDGVTVLAEEKEVTLINGNDAETLPQIHTDTNRLRQVLLNLLSNAVKYNNPGGQVFVGGKQISEDTLRVYVQDTGQGIPREKQENIFVPFNRLGREAGEIEGSGIGLTITQRIVEAIGGKIGFQSEEGNGSEFWVDLPITK